jgi:hypothetical protein|tara:strand:- start:34 stop:243 length:210 start_codon:yes stop_codon:yes gene_type:complete
MYNLALFMEADDLFPPIDEALIKKLNEIYPEKCPDIDTKDRQIWYNAGQRSVVKMLISVYDEQSNTLRS